MTDDGPTIAHEITTFSEQSALSQLTISQPTPKYDMNPYREDTLNNFLQRPRQIASATWTDVNAAGARILQVDPYFELLTSIPFRNKIENFNYFKAGMRIGVRLNGTPFHFGKLMVVWRPMWGFNSQAQQEMRDNIFSASAYPNVIISPTENEVNEMVLPFAFDRAYIDLSEDVMGSPGFLQIYVLNPLALDASVPPVSVTVFANFEDVHLAGQSGIVNLPIHVVQATYSDPDPITPVTFFAAARTPFAAKFVAQGDIQSEAKAKSSAGLISGPMKAVSSAAGALVTIPSIGFWASTVSTVASILGSVAERFGYCKPNSLETTQPVVTRLGDFAAGEGLDTGMQAQLIPGQQVNDFCNELGGKTEDMEISNIVATPSLLSIFTWQAADLPDTTLYATQVDPGETFSAAVGLSTRYYPTMLHWVSKPFKFWRGSLRYDVSITCSNFHSGRLRVSFQPQNNGILTGFDYQNTINRVVDIQSETEFSFTIPYIDRSPWKIVGSPLPNAIQIESIGYIEFSVVNELTHSVEPVPEVHVNVWVSGGPDFQLAFPYRYTQREAPAVAFVAEGLTSHEMKTREHPPLLESASGSVEHGICMVDTVTHIKQVTNRPHYFVTSEINPTTDNQTIVNLFNVTDPNLTSKVDYIDWFRNIFVYSRGSVNVKAIPQWDTRLYPLWVYMMADQAYAYYTNTTRFYNHDSGVGQQIFSSMYNPNFEINIPYYSTAFAYINGGARTEVVASTLGLMTAQNIAGPAAGSYLNMFRSTGDDYTFSYLIGPPSYYLTT